MHPFNETKNGWSTIPEGNRFEIVFSRPGVVGCLQFVITEDDHSNANSGTSFDFEWNSDLPSLKPLPGNLDPCQINLDERNGRIIR